MASCADESTDLLYPSLDCKGKAVTEEFAAIAMSENDFSGGKKGTELYL